MSIFFVNNFSNNDINKNTKDNNKSKERFVVNKDNRIQSDSKSINGNIYKANYIPFLGNANYKQIGEELEKHIAPHLKEAKNGSIDAKNRILEISYDWINHRASKLANKFNNKFNPDDLASDTYMLILDSNLFNGSFDNTFLSYLYTSMKHLAIGRTKKLKGEENKLVSLNMQKFLHSRHDGTEFFRELGNLLIDKTVNIESEIINKIDMDDLFNVLSKKINPEELGILKAFYVNSSELDENLAKFISKQELSDALSSIIDKLADADKNMDLPDSFRNFIKIASEVQFQKYMQHLNLSARGTVDLYNQLSKEKGQNLGLDEFQNILKERIDQRCEVGLILEDTRKLLKLVLGLGDNKKYLMQTEAAKSLNLKLSEIGINKRMGSAIERINKSDIENYLDHMNLTASGFVKLYDQHSAKTLDEFQNELKTKINDTCKKGIISEEDAKLLKLILGLSNDKKWLAQAEAARILKLNLSLSGSNVRINSAIEKINKPEIENYLNHLSKSASGFADLYGQLSKEKGQNLGLDEFQNVLKERINQRCEVGLVSKDEKEFFELMLGLGNQEKWFNQTEANNFLSLNSSSPISKKRIFSVIDKICKTDVENYLDHLSKSASEFVKLYHQLSVKNGRELTLEEFQNVLRNVINENYKEGSISDDNKKIIELACGLGSEKKWLNKTEAAQILKSNKTAIDNYLKHINNSAKGLDELYNKVSKEKGENLTLYEFQYVIKNRINTAYVTGLLTKEDGELLELILGLGKDKKLYSQLEAAQITKSNLSSSAVNLHIKNSLEIIKNLNIKIINKANQGNHLNHLTKSA